MIKKPWIVVFLIITTLLAFWLARSLDGISRRVLETVINQTTREYFAGTVRLKHVHINRSLKLRVDGFEAKLETRIGPTPLAVDEIISLDPLSNLIFQKPVKIGFRGLRPLRSPYQGISGHAVIMAGKEGYFELKADVLALGLEDIAWFDPVNLAGASGRMTGELALKADSLQNATLGIHLSVGEPGGNIQAKFFDMLLPYLPQTQTDAENIRRLRQSAGLLNYRQATLDVTLAEPDKMKIFFRISIPGYNLILNLNIEVRVDKKNSFMQVAQVMGLIEVKPS